jgi:hypothetical protein
MPRPPKNVVNSPDQVTKKQWDDWVPQDRVRKLTDENKELAAQLHTQMKALQNQQKAPKSVKKGGKANGSDFSSTRGSEERHTSAAAPGGRGPRRNRDYDLEHVSNQNIFFVSLLCAAFIVFIALAFAAACGLFFAWTLFWQLRTFFTFTHPHPQPQKPNPGHTAQLLHYCVNSINSVSLAQIRLRP